MPDNLIKIENMKVFRCDRRQNIPDYNLHVTGGGVCIYVGSKWFEFTSVVLEGTIITKDYEIISIIVTKPSFRKLFIVCVYKPPKGKVEKCLEFLYKLTDKYKQRKYEIWILGDLNVNILKRDDANTVRITRFIKKLGLKHCINTITRPNKKGGSCIDLIMTDCIYVSSSGTLDDFVADHYSVYCIRKKKEGTSCLYETICKRL